MPVADVFTLGSRFQLQIKHLVQIDFRSGIIPGGQLHFSVLQQRIQILEFFLSAAFKIASTSGQRFRLRCMVTSLVRAQAVFGDPPQSGVEIRGRSRLFYPPGTKRSPTCV